MSCSSASSTAGAALPARRAIDVPAGAAMVLFCVALGLQQVAIKSAAADITPLSQIALRSMLAAILIWGLAALRGIHWRDFVAGLGPGVLVGLGFTFEFVFVALGLQYTTASHMSVFLYTAPVFAGLGLHFLVPGEQLVKRQWWGMALAFAGLVFAMAPSGEGANAGAMLVGDIFGLLAGMSWAATTLVLRRTALSEAPPLQTQGYQLLTAGVLLLPVVLFSGDLAAMQFSWIAVTSLAFQTLVISCAALLLWFALLRRYWASQLGVFSFLSPIFGVMFGALLLDEPLTVSFLVGGFMLLAGIVTVSRG